MVNSWFFIIIDGSILLDGLMTNTIVVVGKFNPKRRWHVPCHHFKSNIFYHVLLLIKQSLIKSKIKITKFNLIYCLLESD